MRMTKGAIHQAIIGAAVVLLIATPMSAQQALRRGRTLIATLTDGRVIAGRLIDGDSLSLTIDHDGLREIVHRTSIARLSDRSPNGRLIKGFGITGAIVAGTLAAIVVQAFCGFDTRSRCQDVWVTGAAAGGAAGGLTFGSLGSTLGAAYPRWSEISSQASVRSAARPSLDAAPCGRDNQWTTEAGAIVYGGVSARVMGTFFCEPALRSGIEIGYLLRPFSQHSTNYPGSQSPVTEGSGFRSVYGSLVNEWAIGNLPLDPNFVTSIEVHSGSERHLIAQQGSGGNAFRSDFPDKRIGAGLGAGLSLGYNPSRRLAIRLEERTHATPVGVVSALSLGTQWRP